MSYFMRFIIVGGEPPRLNEIEEALRRLDANYTLVIDKVDDSLGDLYYGETVYAEIAINLPGDPLCDEDIDELVEELEKQDDPNRDYVIQKLGISLGMVVIRVLRAGHDDFERLNLLIDWLFATYDGLLQVDEEGIFNAEGRIIALL